MLIPGLSGHEGRVRRRLARGAARPRSRHRDRPARQPDRHARRRAPTRRRSCCSPTWTSSASSCARSRPDGLIRVERLGGVPERALAVTSGAALRRRGQGRRRRDRQQEPPCHDAGGEIQGRRPIPTSISMPASPAATRRCAAGVDIGTPVVYRPQVFDARRRRGLPARRSMTAPAAPCSSRRRDARAAGAQRPTVHFVFSVQEEFNLRGALTAAQALQPDIAIQLDLLLATDTPDMALPRRRPARRRTGGMSLYSFHGRGTLERHHPASGAGRRCSSARAAGLGLDLQRSAHTGALTDSSYVQLVGQGRGVHRSRLSDALLAFLAGSLRHRRPRRADAAAGRPASPRSAPASASTATTSSDGASISASISAPSNRRASSSIADGARRCAGREAAQDAGAAARAGPSIGRSRIGGAISPSSRRSCWQAAVSTGAPSARWRPAPSGRACCRSTKTARRCANAALYGVDARAAAEIEELDAAIGARPHPRALRQCADLASRSGRKSCG